MLINRALHKTHLVTLFDCKGHSEMKHFCLQFFMAIFF